MKKRWHFIKLIIRKNAIILLSSFIAIILTILSYILYVLEFEWVSNLFLGLSSGIVTGIVASFIINYKKQKYKNTKDEYYDFINLWNRVDLRLCKANNEISNGYGEKDSNLMRGWMGYFFEKFEYYQYDLHCDDDYHIKNKFKIRLIKPVLDDYIKEKDEIWKKLDNLSNNDEICNYIKHIIEKYFKLHCNIRMNLDMQELRDMDISDTLINKSII